MSNMVFDPADERSASGFPTEPTRSAITPGTLLALATTLSFVVCLAGFATRQVGLGVGAASVALLAAGGALSRLTAQGRRVRDGQRIA